MGHYNKAQTNNNIKQQAVLYSPTCQPHRLVCSRQNVKERKKKKKESQVTSFTVCLQMKCVFTASKLFLHQHDCYLFKQRIPFLFFLLWHTLPEALRRYTSIFSFRSPLSLHQFVDFSRPGHILKLPSQVKSPMGLLGTSKKQLQLNRSSQQTNGKDWWRNYTWQL